MANRLLCILMLKGHFVSNEVQAYFKTNGIIHLTTLGHAPVAERQIRTIKDMIYKRIEHTKKELVGSALSCAVDL